MEREGLERKREEREVRDGMRKLEGWLEIRSVSWDGREREVKKDLEEARIVKGVVKRMI